MYTPNPIDTKNIALDGDILALSDILAQNTHEVWAAGRIAEGWYYGKVRDDIESSIPALVM